MNRLFAAACILALTSAAPAYSAPPLAGFSTKVTDPQPDRSRGLKFRLIEDPAFAPSPVHNSGMIAQTPVGSNGSLGIGLLRVAPRKAASGEYRPESNTTGSRKAAVRFTLKF